ncbi:TonB-dependent receptor [Pseudoalteromonas sp. M8]|uniref:TonB-dependent receptor plug domain-containing protein n=1 Tax=Pseudoalteromonas sp. M8 TaxID=2692624 RepID=UPI001BA44BAD|nr:TonB-dependent receptor [Pseudoalteromonas sp. M8]QUI71922.1 TonB-dependent receptor plug domain-containing protein [Pseudoalteromonas sp. M8]
MKYNRFSANATKRSNRKLKAAFYALLSLTITSVANADEDASNKAKDDKEFERIEVHSRLLNESEKASPSPVSVMTSVDIEKKQVTTMTDLLRGEFEGIFALNSGMNDWTTQVFSRGNTSWNYGTSDLNEDYMKIFIDGIELVRPTLLSTLSPSMIESIEVVRGPTSGLLYGSEGASGVMKIKTKKGSYGGTLTRPEITLQLNGGVMDSKYTPDGVTPKVEDHYIQVAGGSEEFSYRFGVSHQSVGEWVHRYDSSGTAYSAGIHGEKGRFSFDFTAFKNDRDLAKADFSMSCTKPENYDSERCKEQRQSGKNSQYGLDYPMEENLYALTTNFQASENSTHTLTVGQNENTFSYFGAYPTTNFYSKSNYRMRTVRYSHTYDVDYNPDLTATYITGLDSVMYESTSLEISGFTWGENGEMIIDPYNPPHSHGDGEWNKFGYFGQAEFGYQDKLFFTLAARVDDDIRNVGAKNDKKFQPRTGLTYVIEQGDATVKVRGQWGKSFKPPINQNPMIGSSSWYPTVPEFTPNYNIGPEEKVGWDAGVDLYWRGIGSFSITHFDEEGRSLIMPVALDADAVPPVHQYQNVGVVSNKGWEFDLDLHHGPFSLNGNLTLIDNRIEHLSDVYINDPYEDFKEGDKRVGVPDYTASLTASVDVWGGTVSANAYWLGERPKNYGGYLPELKRVSLRAEKPINDTLTLLARVDNLLRDQDSDRSDTTVAPGRVIMLGARMVF